MKSVKSPLRYPGGKSKALRQIAAYLPANFAAYREPFIGGGSVFLYIRQLHAPRCSYWINDLNPDVFCFWQQAQCDVNGLCAEASRIKDAATDGRELYKTFLGQEPTTDFARALRFFVLNRISFSGTTEAGGYSQKAFETRFTHSSIERLRQLQRALDASVKVTNLDYAEIVQAPGDDVFIFLDPPYLSASKSKLYGKRGALHTAFDHDRFAATLHDCAHRWLVTYDDCPEVRRNFRFANIYDWELQYGMNNYKRDTAPKGKELFISNYRLEQAESHASKSATALSNPSLFL